MITHRVFWIVAAATLCVTACDKPADPPAATTTTSSATVDASSLPPPPALPYEASLDTRPTISAGLSAPATEPAAAPAATPPPPAAAAQILTFATPVRLMPREGGSRIRARPSASPDTPTIDATQLGVPLVATGRVERPDGPWFQLRLNDGGTGYIRGDLVSQ